MNQSVSLDTLQLYGPDDYVRLIVGKTGAIKNIVLQRELICIEIIKAQRLLEQESKRLTWWRKFFQVGVLDILRRVNTGLNQLEGLMSRRQGFTDAINQLRAERDAIIYRCSDLFSDVILDYIISEIESQGVIVRG